MKMKEWSALMRDAPQTPRERALFWIEYVLRHKGARSLQPPTVHTPFYQYFLIDVISFLALVTLLPTVLLYKIVRRLCRSKTPRDKFKRH
jgi:glucuronosyltransferase